MSEAADRVAKTKKPAVFKAFTVHSLIFERGLGGAVTLVSDNDELSLSRHVKEVS